LAFGDAVESSFVLLSDIRPLLDLDDLAFLQHLEAVTAEGKEDDVTSLKNGAFKIMLICGVKVYPDTT